MVRILPTQNDAASNLRRFNSTNEDRCLRLSVCGFSNAQIAEILSIPSGSVKTNLYEARKKARSGRGV